VHEKTGGAGTGAATGRRWEADDRAFGKPQKSLEPRPAQDDIILMYHDIILIFRRIPMAHEPGGPPTARKSVLLRLPSAVHKALARWARDEMRSLQAQVEYVLRKALAESGRGRK